MGWTNGSKIFAEIAEVLEDAIDDEKTKTKIYEAMINIFEEADCDNIAECTGISELLDDIIKDKYSVELDDDIAEGDDWPDGSVENFR